MRFIWNFSLVTQYSLDSEWAFDAEGIQLRCLNRCNRWINDMKYFTISRGLSSLCKVWVNRCSSWRKWTNKPAWWILEWVLRCVYYSPYLGLRVIVLALFLPYPRILQKKWLPSFALSLFLRFIPLVPANQSIRTERISMASSPSSCLTDQPPHYPFHSVHL